VLLNGSGEEEIEFTYDGRERGRRQAQRQAPHPFEGILPNFERRFRETDSAAVREDLARYQARARLPALPRHAPAPRGAARVPAATPARRRTRRADLRDRARDAAPTASLLRGPAARGREAEIADKVVREIRSR
jgi:excinuclease ABC subunit A